MNLRFKQIQIHNFFSISDIQLDLDYEGYTVISGINNSQLDNANSNGSGKSAIWEALCWAITGETIRGTNQVTKLDDNDGCYVRLQFYNDNDFIEILRAKDHKEYKSTIKFIVNKEDKSGKGIRDTQKAIQEYLPELNTLLINSVIILGQGLPYRFSNNTPSKRKEILETLSKSDFMILSIKDRIDKRKQVLQTDLRAVEDKLLSLNTTKANLNNQLNKLNNDLIEIKKQTPSSLETQLNELYNQADIYEKDIFRSNDTIEHLTESIEKYNKDKDRLTNSYQTNYNNEVNRYHDKHQAQNNSIIQLDFEIKNLRHKIDEAESLKDVCPTCGQKIINFVKPNVSQEKAQLVELQIKLEKIKAEDDAFCNEHSDKMNKIEQEYQTELRTINDNIAVMTKNISEHKKINSEANKNLTEVNQKIQENINLTNQYKALKDNIENNIKQVENNLTKIENDILNNTKYKEDIDQRLSVIKQFSTVASRDFRGYLLQNVIDYINEQARIYAKDVCDSNSFYIKLNDNNIDIVYNNKMYENLSGGEKQKIDIVVQFSIRKLLCDLNNFSSNILVLDEIFDNLDSIGCNKLLDFISNKISDINCIYIITHHADIDIPKDREIFVIKDENGSSVK